MGKRFMIIGRGSMAQRRIRCLETLGYSDYTTWDITDTETVEEVVEKYNPDYMLICSPPKTKQPYIYLANKYNIPCFTEADVILYTGDYCPSETMVYHPCIQTIHDKLLSRIGRIYAIDYHLGQHLRDWHVGADYTNYYAAQKDTGGCKEMFAFELTWLSYLFGKLNEVVGFIDKRLNDEQISADDVYSLIVRFGKERIPATILIDTVSRPAERSLKVFGEKGTLSWSWDKNRVLIDNGEEIWSEYVEVGNAAEGYHQSICEDMYIAELKQFIEEPKPDLIVRFREFDIMTSLLEVENAAE